MNHPPIDTIGVVGTTPLATAIAVRLASKPKGPRIIVHGLETSNLASLPKSARLAYRVSSK